MLRLRTNRTPRSGVEKQYSLRKAVHMACWTAFLEEDRNFQRKNEGNPQRKQTGFILYMYIFKFKIVHLQRTTQ